jgi:RES domain-containing protein
VAHGTHDSALLESLASLEARCISAQVFRITFADRDPIAPSFAGGRWAPPQEVPVLYTSFDSSCALAEIRFHFERQPLFPSKPVNLHTLQVDTHSTLDLGTETALDVLGLTNEVLRQDDYRYLQEIGHAAYFLDFDGIVVPSARFDGQNLVLFSDRLPIDHPKVVNSEPVDWALVGA